MREAVAVAAKKKIHRQNVNNDNIDKDNLY